MLNPGGRGDSTVPSRPNRLATLGNPVLTGMSLPALAKLIGWPRSKPPRPSDATTADGAGTGKAEPAEASSAKRSPTPNASSQSSSACARSAPGRSWPNCSRSADAPSATRAPGSARYWTRNSAPSAVPRPATPARRRYLPLSQDTKAHRPGPKHHFESLRLHYAANLMSATPKASWPWVKTMLHSVYDQPDAASVHAQYDRLADAVAGTLPQVAGHLDAARADVLAFTSFPKNSGARSGPATRRNASTGKSAGEPTSSGSSRAATPSSALSAPSWPNRTTNGPKAAATSASTSSPAPASPSPPTPETLRR